MVAGQVVSDVSALVLVAALLSVALRAPSWPRPALTMPC